MKIVVDENMPHACELFAEFGEVVPLPGRQIGAADLQDADVLLVRSVTRVDAGLLASCPRLGFVGTATPRPPTPTTPKYLPTGQQSSISKTLLTI